MLLGLIGGLALSPKLWVSSRYYPLTPVGPLLHAFLFPFDYIAYFALLALLLALCGTQAPHSHCRFHVDRALGDAGSIALAALVLPIRIHAARRSVGWAQTRTRRAQHVPPDRRGDVLLERAGQAESQLHRQLPPGAGDPDCRREARAGAMGHSRLSLRRAALRMRARHRTSHAALPCGCGRVRHRHARLHPDRARTVRAQLQQRHLAVEPGNDRISASAVPPRRGGPGTARHSLGDAVSAFQRIALVLFAIPCPR